MAKGNDERGTMNDELAGVGSQKSAARVTGGGDTTERKPECFTKQKRCKYMIERPRFLGTGTKEAQKAKQTQWA